MTETERVFSKRTIYQRKYLLKHPWMKHLEPARRRAKKYNRVFDMDKVKLKILWERDNASSLKRPSLDRIDNKLGYFFENCRFIELSENIKLGLVGRVLTEKQRVEGMKNLIRWHRRGTRLRYEESKNQLKNK